MSQHPDIVIVEDDNDDQFLLEQAFETIGCPNPRIYFSTGQELINYLYHAQARPLVIICDMQLGKGSALGVRRTIQADPILRQRGQPFVFISGQVTNDVLDEAFEKLNVHGFFGKGSSFEDLTRNLSAIVSYWTLFAQTLTDQLAIPARQKVL